MATDSFGASLVVDKPGWHPESSSPPFARRPRAPPGNLRFPFLTAWLAVDGERAERDSCECHAPQRSGFMDPLVSVFGSHPYPPPPRPSSLRIIGVPPKSRPSNAQGFLSDLAAFSSQSVGVRAFTPPRPPLFPEHQLCILLLYVRPHSSLKVPGLDSQILPPICLVSPRLNFH